MSIEPRKAPAVPDRAKVQPGTTGQATPLYVVCSPCRGVGKTLVSRLLTEFYILDDRPVAAFDLADEAPQLADYLPQFTTTADIRDIRGQMAFFDRLIADNGGAKIVDLSHRAFRDFFTVVERIGFFQEARRRSIEPLILFIIDSDPRSPKAYATLRRWFTEASLLPVRNRISDHQASADASTPPASLEIPLLDFSLRAVIDRQPFSFCELEQATPADLADAVDDELRDWVEDIFLQFRDVEVGLGCEPPSTGVGAARRQHATGRGRQRQVAVPYEVLKFAPKRMRHQSVSMDRSGSAIVGMLQEAGRQLRAAEDRVDRLETEIERAEERAVRAETWLQLIGAEIEEKLFEPAAVSRSKIDDLSP
jgi:hypothetical protein